MENKKTELDILVQELNANIDTIFRDLPSLTNIDKDLIGWDSLVRYYETSYKLQVQYLFATAGLKYDDLVKDEELAFRRISMLKKAVETAVEYTSMRHLHISIPDLTE